MKKVIIIGVILLLSVGVLYSQNNEKNRAEIVLAGGCFWGAEHFLKQIKGVKSTDVGMANVAGVIIKDDIIVNKGTGGAEVVRVEYDPQIVSLQKILELYFMTIDPTSLNRQGEDVGVGYRTGIYYTDNSDLPIIDNSINNLSKEYTSPIVIEVLPLTNYYPAKESQQDYLDKNVGGYCRIDQKLFDYVKQDNLK